VAVAARPSTGPDNSQQFGTVAFYAALGRAFVVMCAVVPLLAVIELVNLATHNVLNMWGGILPRSTSGLDGIFFAPFLHVSFDHLLANSVPLILLGTFMLAAGTGRFIVATLIIMAISGAGAWFVIPPNHVVVGASGVLFGWLSYLLTRGILQRSAWNFAVTALVGLLYGWEIVSALPAQESLAWQAHLFGFLGGIVAAAILLIRPSRAVRAARAARAAPQEAAPARPVSPPVRSVSPSVRSVSPPVRSASDRVAAEEDGSSILGWLSRGDQSRVDAD
jgi:membrane associated rhomboid family serine protease